MPSKKTPKLIDHVEAFRADREDLGPDLFPRLVYEAQQFVFEFAEPRPQTFGPSVEAAGLVAVVGRMTRDAAQNDDEARRAATLQVRKTLEAVRFAALRPSTTPAHRLACRLAVALSEAHDAIERDWRAASGALLKSFDVICDEMDADADAARRAAQTALALF